MVRAMRSRKPHSKYPPGEYELSTSPRKSPAKKMESETKSVVSKGLRSGLTKGNLITGWRTLKGTRTVVLRDRTNLHEELLKVDLLIKQGTGEGIATKSTKSTRNTGSKATDGKDEGEAKKTSSVGGTTKKRKLENDDEAMSLEDLKSRKKNRTDNEETVTAPKRSTKSRSGKIAAEIPKKATRAKVLKVDKDEDESADENSNKKANSSDSKGSSLPVTRSSNNRRDVEKKVAAKTTRKIVKSTPSQKDDDQKLAKTRSSKLVRNSTRKFVAERESSIDSGLGTRDVAEKDENEESEIKTNSVGSRKKSVEQGTSRKTTISKKSKENVDFAKKTSRSRSKANEVEAKAGKNLPGEKKFFKTKTAEKKVENLSPVKRTVTAKRRNIGNARLSVSFRLRQTTLQESFATQSSRKVLRPRKSQKNYCEQTMLEKKGTKTGSKLEEGKKTGPVYKTVKLDEDAINDKNAIYEFQFDSNDSQEKLPKKKKRNVRKNIAKKKLLGTKKTTKTTNSKIPTEQPGIEKTNLIEKVSSGSEKRTESREMEIDNFPEEMPEPLEIEENTEQQEKVEKSKIMTEKSSNAVTGGKAKPKIIGSIDLKGNDCLTLTTTPVLSKSSERNTRNHLRPSKQFRTMLNHALLNKSLSPISKASENFDPGSPWRPPVLQDFSRVKNIVQSTPQVRNFTGTLQRIAEKTATVCNSESKSAEKSDPKISKSSGEKSSSEVTGAAKSPRKFGTVISNLNTGENVTPKISDSENINSKDKERGRQKIEFATIQDSKIGSTAIDTRLAITSSDTIADDHGMTLHFSNQHFEDKENSLPVVSTSKRSPLKSLNRTPFGNLNNSPSKNLNRSPLKNLNKSPLKSLNKSPLKNVDRPQFENLNKSPSKNLQKSPLKDPKKILTMLRAKRMQKENQEPQAGPSNEKVAGTNEDSRVLRQSNLDNYLNIDEMPKSTRITTSHGFFDDAHSTPISGKPAKKIIEDANVENAFGFDVSDEDSELDVSPIKKSLPENPPEFPVPARLSPKEIKKELLPVAIKEAAAKWKPIIERIEEEDDVKEKSDEKKEKQKKVRVRKIPINLADTFDVGKKDESNDESSYDSSDESSEENNEESNEESPKAEVELFADIEPPQHFKQAPKHSYKRKRACSLGFSKVDVNSENVEAEEGLEPKRRKVGKADKKREEQLENWVKDVNKTFEEIDHFDLVVE